MPTIKIDNKEYDFDTLPDAAKQQLQSVLGTYSTSVQRQSRQRIGGGLRPANGPVRLGEFE